jgi:hypothetical protein
MDDYPALMPPAAVPALMQQPEMGALGPRSQFAIRSLMNRLLLPFYDHVSQQSRAQGGPMGDEQLRWDQYVRSVLQPEQPQSRFAPYINGSPVHNPNPSQLIPPWIGVRG